MDGAESSLNGQTPDDGQPRSLKDSGIYSIGELQQPSTSSASGQWQPESQTSLEDSGIAKEDDKTDIGSASWEKLGEHTGDDNEGKELSGASLAQKPVVQDTHVPGLHAPFNDQDLVGYYAQLQWISVWIAEAKNDIARYLQDGTGNVDLSQAFQAGNRIFDETVALKRNGEELMNKFQLNSSGQGQIMKETTTFETPETIMQTELVTTKTSLPTYHPQNGEACPPTEPVAQDLPNIADLPVAMETQETSSDITIPPMDEVHQHSPDTPGMLESMYTTGPKGDLYVEEPSSGTTSDSADPAPPAPTEKENDGNAELQNSRLSIGREQKWIQLNLGIKFSCIDPDLDYSVLELDIPDSQFQMVQESRPGLGHLVQKLGKGQKVTLIGHPYGEPLSMDPNCPVGSSGSPAFDDNVHLVGMHTRGFPTDGPYQIEQMIRMTAIRAEVKLYQPDLCDDLFFSQSYLPP
ncbi:hypothetical protein Bbelb_105330 [Branchiostoma belcheri]|nr:hypothetical protein Bbelb_105330 [Branchiostoma belcheri]